MLNKKAKMILSTKAKEAIKTVKDNSTMKDGGLPSSGIPYVMVNGTMVVKDSKVLKGICPGKAIRLPVMK